MQRQQHLYCSVLRVYSKLQEWWVHVTVAVVDGSCNQCCIYSTAYTQLIVFELSYNQVWRAIPYFLPPIARGQGPMRNRGQEVGDGRPDYVPITLTDVVRLTCLQNQLTRRL